MLLGGGLARLFLLRSMPPPLRRTGVEAVLLNLSRSLGRDGDVSSSELSGSVSKVRVDGSDVSVLGDLKPSNSVA